MTDVCTKDYSIDETVNERKKTTIFIWFCSAMSVSITQMTIPSSFSLYDYGEKNCVAAPFARTAYNLVLEKSAIIQPYMGICHKRSSVNETNSRTALIDARTNERTNESKCQINALRNEINELGAQHMDCER